jgi:hypothetical protein
MRVAALLPHRSRDNLNDAPPSAISSPHLLPLLSSDPPSTTVIILATSPHRTPVHTRTQSSLVFNYPPSSRTPPLTTLCAYLARQSSVATLPPNKQDPSPTDTPRNSSLCQSKISRPTVRGFDSEIPSSTRSRRHGCDAVIPLRRSQPRCAPLGFLPSAIIMLTRW